MIKYNVFSLESPYRDTMRITGYRFGDYTNKDVKKSCAILGAMRGNEVQQLYISGKIIHMLKALEEKAMIESNHEIMVIPSINNYALNINKRFWALDSTDINRMFPGYDKGETTQRIAYHVFQCVKEYDNGIQFASSYMPGNFTPHVRMMKTDYTDLEGAKLFGLPYIFVRDCKPYDTTTLNYNWQLWETNAFSLYSGATADIDEKGADIILESVLNFLIHRGIIKGTVTPKEESKIFSSKDFSRVSTKEAGIFRPKVSLGDHVQKGDCLANIIHPYDGSILEKIIAPHHGIVFFAFDQPFVQEGVNVFRMLQ
jgi:predicted deacylase